ncbi:YbaK/proline--tRNA ligase associated domain protein [Edwardsiella tarda ATCC 23685]|uniref:YbaK/proline--tRNA ligase associated domain protein n=1 Tax=Edwardsiella tarda ATCC 23685 TaxID=500638 RepID=D4FAL5_EDWTA|nr:YbaK/proline--tRNA ligase associated domain protein [Edwardsiella tarda ATCC 23685]
MDIDREKCCRWRVANLVIAIFAGRCACVTRWRRYHLPIVFKRRETVSQATFERLQALLDSHAARYRVVEHPSAGKSEEVAKIRGTQLGQGAKALVCHVKGNGIKQHVLAVLPADQQADLNALARGIGGTRASLASPAEVNALTDCVFGAIPPFSLHPDLLLVADPLLFSRFDELAFNAGTLERSLILNCEDYRRIAAPRSVMFIRQTVES